MPAQIKLNVILMGGLIGALSGGGLMSCGTVALGHMRPMWMELTYAIPAAIAGFVLGAIVGLLVSLS